MALDIPEQKVQRAIFFAQGDCVVLQGEIDQNDPDVFLDPFFKKVCEQMGESITLDITRLNFLNSAAISCLLEFIMNRKPRTRVTIKVDKSKGWQRYSINVVQALDADNIILEDFKNSAEVSES